MVKKKTWQEFRKTGLLWFMNTILHAFGWAIVVEVERSYTEILNLSEMLDKDGIQYEKERLYDGWHIGIPCIWPERERKYSIIEHAMSYGRQHDLVELAKYDEDQNGQIIGSLTAAVAMEYIKGERE